MNKKTLLTILLVVLVLLVIAFFIYLRIEGFTTTSTISATSTIPATSTTRPSTTRPSTTTPNCQPAPDRQIESIMSYVANYQIDLEKDRFSNKYFLKYYGIGKNDPTGVLAVDVNDNDNLVVQILNDNRPNLRNLWYINKLNNDPETLVISLDECTNDDCSGIKALTYTTYYMENSIISYLPFSHIHENQLWIPTTRVPKRGLPVNKGIILSSELNNPNTSAINLSELNLNESNEQKVSDILNLINQNLQSFKQITQSDSGSALGLSGNTPIKVNLSLSNALSSLSQNTKKSESFQDTNNIRELLDKYENKNTNVNTGSVYTLDNALSSVISCPVIDNNDYTISRVGQCNCDLSQL